MNRHDQARREEALLRYYLAVTSGDLDTACAVMVEAAEDPVLERQIVELEDALTDEEAGAAALERDRALIQELLDQHLSHEPDAPPPPLTVGQVVSRMQADRGVGTDDQSAARALQASQAPLPAQLGARTVRELLGRLGARTSERFQRLFRDTAVLLGLAASEEHAAFARRTARATPPADMPASPEGTPPETISGGDRGGEGEQ
jgi:hypothetical protein